MHYLTVTGHSDVTLRATSQDVSGRLSSFCCLLTSQIKPAQNNFDTHQSVTGLAGVGTRLYDSPAELYGYATNNVAYCRPSSSASFRAQLTGERDRPLCSNETSDLRQNWTLCDHRTSPLCMHLASRTRRIVAAVPGTGPLSNLRRRNGDRQRDQPAPSPTMANMPGTTYVIISWCHNFMFAIIRKCSMFHER